MQTFKVLFNSETNKFEAVARKFWKLKKYEIKHPDQENIQFDTLSEAEHWMSKEYFPESISLRPKQKRGDSKIKK